MRVSLLPLQTLKKYAVGDAHVFPNQDGGNIEDEMKMEKVGLMARVLVAKRNPDVMCPPPPAPKISMRQRLVQIIYHTAKRGTMN